MLCKHKASHVLALYLVCLMVFAPFVGLLGSPNMSASENNRMTTLEMEKAISAVEELPLRMSADLVYDSESDRFVFFGGATSNR